MLRTSSCEQYESAEFLLRSVQQCVEQKVDSVVFVQHGGGAGALARSLFLEHREMAVTVVECSRFLFANR